MGFLTRRNDGGDEVRPGQGLELDLDPRVCATCRRELLPWQERCPDDGGAAVAPSALPPVADPRATRLSEELEGDDPTDP